MNKNTILNALAWISLAVAVVFVLWYIFGNSPTEWYLLLPLIFTILFKLVTISNDVAYFKGDYNGFKENVKESFQRTKEHNDKVELELKDIKKILSKK